MRGPLTRQLRRVTLLGCLLGATCDQPAAAPVICLPGQVLGTDGNRQLLCVGAPLGKIATPSCDTALTSDGQLLLCTSRDTSADKDADVSATLLELDGMIKDIQALLQPTVSVAQASYVGTTSMPNTGRFLAGFRSGLVVAAQQCAAQFGAGAHMCVMDELYQSVGNGTLGAADSIPPAWVYMPNWNIPTPNPDNPLQGVADTCDNYTYQLGARRWRGILVEWGPLPDGTAGFRWHGGNDTACSSVHPVACCK